MICGRGARRRWWKCTLFGGGVCNVLVVSVKEDTARLNTMQYDTIQHDFIVLSGKFIRQHAVITIMDNYIKDYLGQRE